MEKIELDRLHKLVEQLRRAGADQVDAYYEWGRNTNISARNGEVENLKQAVSQGVGVRVFKNHQLGFGFTSDISPDGLSRLGEKTLALAHATAIDPNHGLPDKKYLGRPTKAADAFDPQVEALDNATLTKNAILMEKVALAADPRIKTVQEVGAGCNVQRVALVNSEGFAGDYAKTYAWLYADTLAEADGQKQSGSFVDQATHWADLLGPEAVAQEAARRGVRTLGARKIPSAQMPVIFEPPLVKAFLRGLLGALNGEMVFLKSSFLADKLGQTIASPLFTVVDDGGLDRRSGSQPFDGEGLATRRQTLFDKGALRMFLYDVHTANQAGAQPSGTAGRGYAALPTIGSTNLFLEPGDQPPAALRRGLDRALLVTDMMGQGVNTVTGDYSRGAKGFLIEKGEIVHPVQEVTVAAHMLDMLRNIDMVANDMEWRGSVGAPSIRFAKMTVAGK
jgi:PmbA protein